LPQLTKEMWLKEGFQVLSESGVDGLTIEALATRLGVTKGSFYHHFNNRGAYAEELLKFWEAENTLRIKQLADHAETTPEKIKTLIALVSHLPHEPEVAIRAWALRDPLARAYQERVDRLRLDYLTEVHLPITNDRGKARIEAQLAYAVLVGSQHMVPAIHGGELQQLFEELVWGLYRCAF
jgi:AcrR family transcriptional regulator